MSKTVLFIQIDNFADFLRLINLVKSISSSLKFILITKKKFILSAPLDISGLFEKVFFIEKKDLLTSADFKAITGNISNLIDEILKTNPDLVINLSVSKTASILMSLLQEIDGVHLGARYDKNFRLEILGDINSYIFANIENRYNAFNLGDLYRITIGAKAIDNNHKEIKSILIHPYHSHERGMWHHSKWVDILISLSDKCPALSIYLVDDFNLFRNYIFKSNIVVVDKDDFIMHLKIVDLVVSHYEQTILIADYYKKQSLFIPLGPNNFIKNGSGQKDNYIITPRINCFPCNQEKCNKSCHSFVKTGLIVNALYQLVKEGEITYDYLSNYAKPTLSGSNIYKSYYDHNLLLLKNINQQDQDEFNAWYSFYVLAFSYVLFKEEIILPFLEIDDKVRKNLEFYRYGLQHLYELNEFGKKYTYSLLDELKKKNINHNYIREYSTKIDEIDELQEVLKKTYPGLTPIIELYKLKNRYISFENLAYLSYDSFLIYHEASLVCQVVYELIEKSLGYKKDLKYEK